MESVSSIMESGTVVYMIDYAIHSLFKEFQLRAFELPVWRESSSSTVSSQSGALSVPQLQVSEVDSSKNTAAV